jgi:predicted histone-like DNA-binding protein
LKGLGFGGKNSIFEKPIPFPMPLIYKVIEKAQPGVAGGGKRRYYASANYASNKVSLATVVKMIESRSTVHKADCHAVIAAFTDVLTELVSDGKYVELGELGGYSLTFSSLGKDTPEEVTPDAIKNIRFHWKPSPQLKQNLNSLTFKKVSLQQPSAKR